MHFWKNMALMYDFLELVLLVGQNLKKSKTNTKTFQNAALQVLRVLLVHSFCYQKLCYILIVREWSFFKWRIMAYVAPKDEQQQFTRNQTTAVRFVTYHTILKVYHLSLLLYFIFVIKSMQKLRRTARFAVMIKMCAARHRHFEADETWSLCCKRFNVKT